MSFIFDGATDHLEGSLATSYDTPCTIACKLLLTTHPGVLKNLFQIGSSASSNATSIRLAVNNVVDEWAGSAANAASVFANALVPSVNGDGIWTSLVMVCTADNDRTLTVNSTTNTDENTLSRDMANTLQFIRVADNMLGLQDFEGRIAELAFWNIALIDSDVDLYHGNLSASLIQTANLPLYVPMATNSLANQGTDTDGDLTAFGDAVFDSTHPTITLGNTATGRMLMLGVG